MSNINTNLQMKAINIIDEDNIKTKETKVFYKDVLEKIQNEENRLSKPYYKFRYDQIVTMLKSWNVMTINSIKTINSVLNFYMDFYKEEGMLEDDFVDSFTVDDLIGCVDNDIESMYFTSYQEYVHFVQSFCYNSQDAVIFSLLFEGVRGIDHQEIKNLREIDCDFKTNTLTLTQDRNELEEIRYLTVDNLTMQIIKDAIYDDMYYKNNGDVAEGNKTDYFNVERNGYVVRLTSRYSDEVISTHTIQQRVRKLAYLYGKERLNPKNVFYSGMLLKLKDIEKQNGEVDNEDFKNMHKLYNMNITTWHATKKLYNRVKDSLH